MHPPQRSCVKTEPTAGRCFTESVLSVHYRSKDPRGVAIARTYTAFDPPPSDLQANMDPQNRGLHMREQLKQIYRSRLPNMGWCDDNVRRKQQVRLVLGTGRAPGT